MTLHPRKWHTHTQKTLETKNKDKDKAKDLIKQKPR